MSDPAVYLLSKCDLCKKDILSRQGEEFVMLRASHYKFNEERFTIQMALCNDCARSFEKWTISKGDDTA